MKQSVVLIGQDQSDASSYDSEVEKRRRTRAVNIFAQDSSSSSGDENNERLGSKENFDQSKYSLHEIET